MEELLGITNSECTTDNRMSLDSCRVLFSACGLTPVMMNNGSGVYTDALRWTMPSILGKAAIKPMMTSEISLNVLDVSREIPTRAGTSLVTILVTAGTVHDKLTIITADDSCGDRRGTIGP